jgi:antibiotic biosynthesis monooxygenase (ABM) superfamily enzyme
VLVKIAALAIGGLVIGEAQRSQGRFPVTVQINTYSVKPGRTTELLALLTNALANSLASLPGFIETKIYVSRDGTRVVSHSHWDTDIAGVPEIDSLERMVDEKDLIEAKESALYELHFNQPPSRTQEITAARAQFARGDNWRTAP